MEACLLCVVGVVNHDIVVVERAGILSFLSAEEFDLEPGAPTVPPRKLLGSLLQEAMSWGRRSFPRPNLSSWAARSRVCSACGLRRGSLSKRTFRSRTRALYVFVFPLRFLIAEYLSWTCSTLIFSIFAFKRAKGFPPKG